MTTLLFLFAILTTPTDRIICDLWTRELTTEAVLAACPTNNFAGLRADVYTLGMSRVCSKPAEALPRIQQECFLGQLDQYIIRIVQPDHIELACMVESTHADSPAPEEIAAQCADLPLTYTIEPAGTREDVPAFACPARSIPTGAGLYEQPTSAAELATYEELPILAGKLIWWGYIPVTTCNGMSGVTPDQVATPCGYESARPLVIAWQNQFDEAIYNAAIAHNVPARLLKRIIMTESQFWTFYDKGADGEVGILQLTDNGLDTLLRWDPELDPRYQSKSDDAQAWARNNTRDLFVCHNCSLVEVINKIKTNMPYYARLLASYQCRAITINPTLTPSDSWRKTIVDYNGSGAYLTKIER